VNDPLMGMDSKKDPAMLQKPRVIISCVASTMAPFAAMQCNNQECKGFYQFRIEPSPGSCVLLIKLTYRVFQKELYNVETPCIFAEVSNKFSKFYTAGRFITAFASAHHWTPS